MSRLDLDLRGGEVKDFRYKLIPLFADAIAAGYRNDSRYRKGARTVQGRALTRRWANGVASLPPRQFQRQLRRSDLRGDPEGARCRNRALAGLPLGHQRVAGPAITVEDIHNATAITYPQVYRMAMTGTRLKEVLEDVADNLFNPDPYYQQGGDMVRCGGLGYRSTSRSRPASAFPP